MRYIALHPVKCHGGVADLPNRTGDSVDDLMSFEVDGEEVKPVVIIDRHALQNDEIGTKSSSLMLVSDKNGDRYLSCNVLAAIGMLLGADHIAEGILDFATLCEMLKQD